ncbi:MAG: TonB-dependent hemoglobin/transferrin/lactoferrin family receptor [Sphingomonadaceae bacterium]|nr:TonB-dependent hemoglobin/transferrin/lactoferrin family receptor [Sphingomonadaceae bacterium]
MGGSLLALGWGAAAAAQALPAANGQPIPTASATASVSDDASEYGGDGRAITVTATRSEIRVEDAPVTVSVIEDEDIADQMVTDIRDLVRFEPGVTVRRAPARFNAGISTVGRAGNEGFNIRGIGGNRVLIQVDGVRVPYGFSFGAQDVGRGDYVDVSLIKSVEILRGPASALYGSDGLAGAVSFRTADPEDLLQSGQNVGGVARAHYSSADNEFAETLILAGRSGALSAMVGYTRRDFGELENQGIVGGTGAARTRANPQDGASNALIGRIVWDGGSGHRLRLTGEYLDTRLDTDVLSGRSATVDLLTAHDTGERWRAAIDWRWQGSGLFDSVAAALYVQDAEDVQFTREDRTPAADRTRLNSFETRVWGASVEGRRDFTTGRARHRLIVGADYSRTRQRGLRDGTVPPFGETFPTRAFPVTDYSLGGIFIGDEISLGALSLFPALRYDHYRLSPRPEPLLPAFTTIGQSGGRVTPKLGLVVHIADDWRLFGNYAQGFKSPEPTQVNQFFENLAIGYISRPNPNLGPERSRGFEGGIRYVGDHFSASFTAFDMRYRDFISQEVVGGSFTPADPAIFQFVNLSRAEVSGVEGRASYTIDGLRANFALSYASGNFTDAAGVRQPLSTVDPLRIVVGVGYRASDDRFGGDVSLTHHSRKDADRTTGVCTGPCFRPDAATIIDATAWLRIASALTLRLGLFNLTDEKYALWADVRGLSATSTITDAYTQPGRNMSVSISYRF